MASEPLALLLTCEHAGNQVPPEYEHLFASPEAQDLLRSHCGWDPGALPVAIDLALHLPAPLVSCVTSRLLVETNRSLHAPDLFSAFTRDLPQSERDRIIERYYWPHRSRIEQFITVLTGSAQRVLHLGVHSCTDELHGSRREFELGLLFDPQRTFEQQVVNHITECFAREYPHYRVVHNQPYLGTDDGLTTFLRTCFADRAYAGIELEFRQGHITSEVSAKAISAAVVRAVQSL